MTEDKIECGIDEAGRGCLAGPVYAAAVIWPRDISHPNLRDSKRLSATQREEMYAFVIEYAIDYSISAIKASEIDKVNILQATFLAMHRNVDSLQPPPELLLVDGNRFKPFPGIAHKCVVGGDDQYLSIAAASILAKCTRDKYMLLRHEEYPEYDWQNNMGYGTKKHVAAIKAHGYTPLHRRSFRVKALERTLFD